MASTILGIAHFTFHDGKFDDFRRLSDRCRHIVATQDTGTLRYDIYVTEDQTRAVVIEEYENEDALRAHGEHIGEELSTAVLATADVHGQLLGELSEELRNSLIGDPVVHFAPLETDRRGLPPISHNFRYSRRQRCHAPDAARQDVRQRAQGVWRLQADDMKNPVPTVASSLPASPNQAG